LHCKSLRDVEHITPPKIFVLELVKGSRVMNHLVWTYFPCYTVKCFLLSRGTQDSWFGSHRKFNPPPGFWNQSPGKNLIRVVRKTTEGGGRGEDIGWQDTRHRDTRASDKTDKKTYTKGWTVQLRSLPLLLFSLLLDYGRNFSQSSCVWTSTITPPPPRPEMAEFCQSRSFAASPAPTINGLLCIIAFWIWWKLHFVLFQGLICRTV
jgi:hypothetical protein